MPSHNKQLSAIALNGILNLPPFKGHEVKHKVIQIP